MLVQRINKSEIFVCRAGVSDISIPVIEIGSGKKTLSIIAGIHGDETSSLLVIDKLIEKAKGINGKIRILFANSLGLLIDKRTGIDELNLNRIFPGSSDGSISSRIAEKIIENLKDSDAVIDLHNFDLNTPLLGIVVEGNGKKNLELMKSFSPRQCWMIQSVELRFGGTLGMALNNMRIPNIAIELDNPKVIAESQINECVKGIENILCLLGIKNGKEKRRGFDCFKRSVMKSRDSGIFIPKVKVFENVKKGQIIGTIKQLPEFIEIPVKTNSNGSVMQIQKKGFVMPGKEIIAIGKNTWRCKS